jgi:hypothetical protein
LYFAGVNQLGKQHTRNEKAGYHKKNINPSIAATKTGNAGMKEYSGYDCNSSQPVDFRLVAQAVTDRASSRGAPPLC